jgi:hypothetical protein
MADDSMVTRRLKQLADVTAEAEELKPSGGTIELEELDLMATGELEQLLNPPQSSSSAADARADSDYSDAAEDVELMPVHELKQLFGSAAEEPEQDGAGDLEVDHAAD